MNAAAEELYSLLVPLSEDRLIVPRACVAEVVRYSEPEHAVGAPNWLLGTVGWSGRELPIISFEGAKGDDIPDITSRTRIVVFYASAERLKVGYFGLLTQGFPQLVRVNEEVLKLESTDGWPEAAPILCRVRMINEYPLIPNLERLEDMLADELAQT
jgi:chemosensory pili system protein ChpC